MAKGKKGYNIGEIPQGNGNYLTGKMPKKNGSSFWHSGEGTAKGMLKIKGKKNIPGIVTKIPSVNGGISSNIPKKNGSISSKMPRSKEYASTMGQFTGSNRSLKCVMFKE